jgi:hypothetical protein
MSHRSFPGLLAAGLVLSLSQACNHAGGNGSTGTAGTGSTGTGNGSGQAGAGSGNAGASGAAGNTGNPGAAGTATGTGNSVGTAGTNGDAGTVGTTGGAGNNGTGGNIGTTGGGGSGTSLEMIDNLEDNDRQIIAANGRQGPWHSFNDTNAGNIQPPLGTGFVAAAGGANNTTYAVHTMGSGFQFGGVGFDLNNATMTPESMSSMAYNASAYTGITFWAKGSGTLRVEFAMRSFVPTDRGGSCTSNCWNVYGANTPTLTSNWTQITIPWAGMQREQGGTSPAFNPSELMGVSFKGPGTFDFWIDEVAFIRTGGGTGTGGVTGAAGRGGTTGSAGTTGAAGRGGTTGSGGTTGNAGTTGSGGTFNEPMPPPISGGQNAWASRYWDCCKPACGWTGNTGGKTPIKSCSMSNQPLSGYDAKNACENGGSAYMCWNGAPWQVGPNLSYGYVAASGSNYSCGRCYQLQFTGGGHNGAQNSLNGKMMIVQVINNGGVAQDQFDLLIPGGGVGALNACSSQWGTSDLGATYGGFLAGCSGSASCVQQKCQTIFGNKPDLLAGCNWFLGWFGAADNPNMVVKEIACPQMIKDRGLQ